MFKDRSEAGKRLACALKHYRDKDVLVLAIPRGGAVIGYRIAKYLHSAFSLLVVKKLPFPDNPEAGFGALGEEKTLFIFKEYENVFPLPLLKKIVRQQREEVKRRVMVLRNGVPLPKIENKVVILVDDGLAMGSTMRAAIMVCKKNKAKRIVVAVPVSGKETAQEIEKLVDEIVILEKPPFFRAVAQSYLNWYDVPDGEVIEIMKKWEEGPMSGKK